MHYIGVGMKKAVYRPAGYRKKTVIHDAPRGAQDELVRSLKRNTEANYKGHNTSSRPRRK